MSRPPRSLWQEILSLVELAWPVVISRIAIFSLAVVDTIMVGRYASDELAFLGIGLVPSSICILFIVGLLLGTMVKVSNHYGAGRYEDCGASWWRSLPLAIGLGLLGLAICACGETLLTFLGQPPEIAEAGGRVSMIIGLGMPLIALQITTGYFLEGINRVRPGMIIILIVNVANVFLNDILINGRMGFPEMGAEGSAWATVIVRFIMMSMIVAYVWFMHDQKKYAVRKRPARDVDASREQRRIGYAAGLSMGIENTAFSFLSIFAGMIGTLSLATHTITMNFFSLCFMLGLGVGTATAVRVGNANGAGNWRQVYRLGWIGLGTQFALMLPITLCMIFYADYIVEFYSSDKELTALAAKVLSFAAYAILLDAGQSLIAQSFRARGDNWSAPIIHFISFGCLMIPVSYISGIYLERGVFGLYDGLFVGSLVALILCLNRNIRLNRKLPLDASSDVTVNA
jgi:MATE family multidrug resistance protein